MMFLVYGIGIWAMTLELIPKVAAVRDASILFGAVIAYVVLREPVNRIRILGALTIVLALVLIRLG
jgi:drug/metabolite transporter (DMT)-like permease